MKEYKITIISFFWNSFGPIIAFPTSLWMMYFFVFNQFKAAPDTKNWLILILILISIFFLVILPLRQVINHYKYDRHTSLLIDNSHALYTEENKVIYKIKDKNISKEFLISDITLVKDYSSNLRFYDVSYMEIFLKDGSRFRISSQVAEHFDYVKNVKAETTNDLLLYRDRGEDVIVINEEKIVL